MNLRKKEGEYVIDEIAKIDISSKQGNVNM
jgi:hypothetical protein